MALAGFLITLTVSDRTAEAFLSMVYAASLKAKVGAWRWLGIAVLVLAAQAFMLVRWFTLKRYAREIGYQNEFGKVSVSLVAIEEALTRAIEGEAGVRRVSLRVYEDRVKRCVIIEPILTLWEDVNVTAINHRCQELLRARFAELMPDREQVQVNLTLHRLNQRQAVDTSHDSKQVPAIAVQHHEPAGAPASPMIRPRLSPRYQPWRHDQMRWAQNRPSVIYARRPASRQRCG